MDKTTLCYLIKDDEVLLLYRNKKENDINLGKWIGIGGHIEENESALECIKREVKEETNLELLECIKRGIIRFYYNNKLAEESHLFISNSFKGELSKCNEGILKWVKIKDIFNLPMWEGDAYFLKPLFNSNNFINISLFYENDKLVKVEYL